MKLGERENLILQALSSGPKYAYQIAQEIKGRTKQWFTAGAFMFDALSNLMDEGFIEKGDIVETENGLRREYRITEAGKATIERER